MMLADRGLELVGELVHVGLALGGRAHLGLLLLGFHLLDADQVFLEGLRRAAASPTSSPRPA